MACKAAGGTGRHQQACRVWRRTRQWSARPRSAVCESQPSPERRRRRGASAAPRAPAPATMPAGFRLGEHAVNFPGVELSAAPQVCERLGSNLARLANRRGSPPLTPSNSLVTREGWKTESNVTALWCCPAKHGVAGLRERRSSIATCDPATMRVLSAGGTHRRRRGGRAGGPLVQIGP